MNNWQTGTLSDIATIIMGQSPLGEFTNENNIGTPLLNGPTEFGSSYPIPKQYTTDVPKQAQIHDLLFCVRGSTTGRMNWADQEYAIGRGLAAIRHKNGLQAFLRAVIEYKLPDLLIVATGSTFPNVSKSQLHDLKIPIPPLSEQHAIADILGSLDDKIELNRRMNETLEAMARAIFKSWFVDFEPVHAKARGEQPVGMDEETAALFPNSFEESEFGLIPSGWRVGTLGDIAENPRRSAQPQQLPPDTSYIGLEHMPQKSISLATWGTAEDVESNKYQFQKGEFLFGKLRPYFHKVGIAPVDGICSTDILVVTSLTDEWWGQVLMVISDSEFIEYATQVSGGTRMPRVSWKDMSRYGVVMPHKDIANVFSNFVRDVSCRIMENNHQAHTLAEMRDTLLPKLVSGELRIVDTNIEV